MITRDLPGRVDHVDAFSVDVGDAKEHSVDYLTAVVFTSVPTWARLLFKVRNVLVKPFGLTAGRIPELKDIDPSVVFSIGERAIFFTVIDHTDAEVLMAEDDKHLYFRASLLVEERAEGRSICLTTLVQYHNALGRWYFSVIKPFHKMIVKYMLRRSARRLT
jgi:hypothetical protein